MTDPNELLAELRALAAADPAPWKSRGHWDHVERMQRILQTLDAHLTAGGAQPTAWTPDTWGWQGVPDQGGVEPPAHLHGRAHAAPEGLAVFAHWSAVHPGVNVEIDAPEGLPLTVHVNDWRAVNVVVGTRQHADDDVDVLTIPETPEA